mmetsp:Transcript_8849/g.16009  ORF Transcript_8849/g.16009 Transcript_8849/m.16009 type:complete len:173 (-) Transcript_8849:410-928(-)
MRSPTLSTGVCPPSLRRHHPKYHAHYIAATILVAFLSAHSILGFSIGSRSRAVVYHYHGNDARFHATVPSPHLTDRIICESSIFEMTKSRSPVILNAKKQSNNESGEKEDGDSNSINGNNFMGIFKKSPGVAVVAPFVLLFGVDLLLNIAVITKRSLEVLFTGEYTVWTPWQ